MESALVGGAAFDAHGPPARSHPQAGQKAPMPCCSAPWATGNTTSSTAPCAPSKPSWACAEPGPVRQLPPAICYEQLVGASSLKPELVAGLDILIIRELTGDIYFGQPRGRRTAVDGHFPGAEEAFDTMRYRKPEIERIAHVAFRPRASGARRSPAWTRPTCWKPSSSGRTW